MKYFAGCVASAVLASLLTVWLVSPDSAPAFAQGDERSLPAAGRDRGPALVPRAEPRVSVRDELLAEETAAVRVYEKANRSVVNITTRTTDGFLLLDVTSEGSGSGLVIDKAGHVLTNFHVVEEARQVGITLYNGKTYEATMVGADPINDLCVLKIDAPADVLHPVVVADSNKLKVGMRVFAIGNPFGLERTMTTGIISSLNRSLQVRRNRTIRSIIQIDAAVNPGNSGGPLLDSRGRLIGVNTAIASANGQSAGVGFAIPSNLVARVVPQLIKHGRVIRPEIGILRVYETERGLLIARLKAGGAAQRAGLRGPRVTKVKRGIFVVERQDRSAADLIVGVDGEPVKTADDFLSYIESKRPGEAITLDVVREGRRISVPVTLGTAGQINSRRK